MTQPARTIHAGCILIGEAGVLVTGASGSGKSTLQRHAVAAARQAGLFAALVSDDRTVLRETGGRLLARPHPAIAGREEIRGLGIVETLHEPAAVIRLVAGLTAEPPARLPGDDEARYRFAGMDLPRIGLESHRNAVENAAALLEVVRRLTAP